MVATAGSVVSRPLLRRRLDRGVQTRSDQGQPRRCLGDRPGRRRDAAMSATETAGVTMRMGDLDEPISTVVVGERIYALQLLLTYEDPSLLVSLVDLARLEAGADAIGSASPPAPMTTARGAHQARLPIGKQRLATLAKSLQGRVESAHGRTARVTSSLVADSCTVDPKSRRSKGSVRESL